MEAARAGNLGCVKVLVDAGASLFAKDVSRHDHHDSVESVVGADFSLLYTVLQRDGNTAEHLARMAGHSDIEDFLREQAESVSDREQLLIVFQLC